MSDVNKVFLSGNLVRDPEVRYTPQGQAVCEFTIATNKRWVTETGEKREKVTFVGCVCWGPKGEAFAKHHGKGQRALVEGELQQETWEDKDSGKKREKTKVRVAEWFFTGNAKQEGQLPRSRTTAKASEPSHGYGGSQKGVSNAQKDQVATQNGGSTTATDDDDVPF